MKNSIKLSIAVLFLLLTSFTFQSCDTAQNVVNTVENKDLGAQLAGTWILTSIEGTKAADAFKGTIPTLSFDLATHKVSGNGGCNNYSGGFTLISTMYTPTPMVSTMMACPQENKESRLLELLGKKSTLVFNNNILQFVQNGKVVLEFSPK